MSYSQRSLGTQYLPTGYTLEVNEWGCEGHNDDWDLMTTPPYQIAVAYQPYQIVFVSCNGVSDLVYLIHLDTPLT